MKLVSEPTALAKYGKFGQIGFVCKDLAAAAAFWTKAMGAGPFYEMSHVSLAGTKYRGKPAEVDLSAALGYFGGIQVELIKQHCDTPSLYREWIDAGGTGIQHIAMLVDDFDGAFGALIEAGGVAAQETEIPGAVRAAFFDLPGEHPIIEILQLSNKFASQWRRMREEAEVWDGSRPLRSIAELD